MIQSLWRIDFLTGSRVMRLLDYGDFIANEIAPKVTQRASEYGPIGSEWGDANPEGIARVSLSWTRRQNHDSHAVSRAACLRAAASFPSCLKGTLQISIQDGEVWEITKTIVSSTEPTLLVPDKGFRSIITYTATGGRMRPLTTLPLFSGMPWDWINQTWENTTLPWESI